jgi:hypothetical protein
MDMTPSDAALPPANLKAIGLAGILHPRSAKANWPGNRLAAVLVAVIAVGLMPAPARAGDTERLADCIAIGDSTQKAAEIRNAGNSPEKTIVFETGAQATDRPNTQVNPILNQVHSKKLNPNEEAAEAFQECFEAE